MAEAASAAESVAPPIRRSEETEGHNWGEQGYHGVVVEQAQQDYTDLRRQITQYSTKSGTHDEEAGFDLEKFLRGRLPRLMPQPPLLIP